MTAETVGRLEGYGLEEVEPGLIADTPENLQFLFSSPGWSWTRDTDDEGEYTGLLAVRTPEQTLAAREGTAEKKKHLLVDKTDPWSDYLEPDDIYLETNMPTWIRSKLRRWRELNAEGVPVEERSAFPRRCTTVRYDGTRCWNWAGHPDKNPRCSHHSHENKKQLRQSAAYSRQQLIDGLPRATDNLMTLALHADGEAVRLKATSEWMDRAGLRGGVEIDVSGEITHVDPGMALHDRLQKLAKRQAEQITEEPELSPPKALTGPEIVEAELVLEEGAETHDA